MVKQTKITVIIPVYNDWKPLGKCLDSLKSQTLPSSEFEVIVVDNGSEDPRPAQLENYLPNLRWLHESEGYGFNARNKAIHNCDAELFAFTDADCILNEDWLEKGLALLEQNPSVDIFAGQVQQFPAVPGRPTLAERFQILFYLDLKVMVEVHRFCATCNLFTRRRTFEKAGDFKTHLTSGGDREWCYRAQDAGAVLRYDPGPKMIHPCRPDLASFIRLQRRIAGGFYLKHKESGDVNKHLLWMISRLPMLPLTIYRRMQEAKVRLSGQISLMDWIAASLLIPLRSFIGIYEVLRCHWGGSSKRTV